MGRPTKLTPEVQERLLLAISAGNTREAAAIYAGIGERTLYRWIAKGENGKRNGKFRQLWQALREAENAVEIECVAIIRRAMSKDWRAATWWLERRKHGAWGRKASLDVTIHREAERLAKKTGLSVEEIIAEAERIVRGEV